MLLVKHTLFLLQYQVESYFINYFGIIKITYQ